MSENAIDVAGQSAAKIDAITFDILRILRSNGRISVAALAQEVGISRANAYTRIDDLTRAGVITGFTAEVNVAKLGLGVSGQVFCSVQPQQWSSFLQAISEIPDIESARVLTGEHDVMLLVRSTDIEAMQTLIIGTIAKRPEVTKIETVIELGEVFGRPYVLPDELPVRDPAGVASGLMRFTRTGDRQARVRK